MDDIKQLPIELLWQSFLAGDDRSFSIIYERYAGSLLTYGRKFNIDNELVGDALQEVFVDLYLKRDRFGKQIKNLKAYLFIALKNNLLKKINHRKKWQFQVIEGKGDELEFSTEYNIQEYLIEKELSKEIQQKLQAAVAGLSPKQKEIIYLKFEEELDYPEIARVLKIGVESARKQIYRAIKTLRETIDTKILSNFFLIFLKKSR
ncbi:RNA polymerase sigma factor [Gaoshiqia sp. Z1-71]|uniref:RNA polymerase sigma factor n=1 Tax=Gaoshiqia hydrogeniformans TaxID=3290090 RepID=UPI003BF8F9A8